MHCELPRPPHGRFEYRPGHFTVAPCSNSELRSDFILCQPEAELPQRWLPHHNNRIKYLASSTRRDRPGEGSENPPPQSRPVQQDVRWFSPRWIRPSTGLLLALRMRVPFLCPDAAGIPGSLSHAHLAGPTGLPPWLRR